MGATAAVHPADPILQAYGLGKLDDVSSALVSQHLEECDPCQKRFAELSSDEFLGRLQRAQAKPDKATSGWSPFVSSTEGTARPVVPPPPVDTLPPELIGHPDYEIVRELGRGGMGVVYLAQNKLMGRPEVLKVVGRHLIERPGVADRFLREIRSAAKLHHANIVTAHAAIRLGESLVLAMEYVEGLDLAKIVKTKGPLPVAHACYFIHQAALGLQHAHERGMVHRDIKPANLILARDGKKAIVKVLDFGLAKVTSEGQTDSALTREGQMLGTPDYIAPEQIRNAQSADIRADIYSLGCTFYYLLSGEPPFRGDHLWDVYQAHFSMEAGPLNLVRPEVPAELAAVVAKMMAKEPGWRFQTPGEVARALAPFFKPAPLQSTASSAELPRVEIQVAPTQPSSAGPAATPSATLAAALTQATQPSNIRANDVAWETLIQIKELGPLTEPPKPKRAESEPVPADAPTRRSPWVWRAIIAATVFGVLIVGIIIVVKRGDKEALRIEHDPKPANNDSGQRAEASRPANDGASAIRTIIPPIIDSKRYDKALTGVRVASASATALKPEHIANSPAEVKEPAGAGMALPRVGVGLDLSPATWQKGAPAANSVLSLDGRTSLTVAGPEAFDMTNRDYTIFARIKTRRGGTIFSKAAKDGRWVSDGKTLFVRNGKLGFDIGWVGYVEARRRIDDDLWHSVALTYNHQDHQVRLFIDGQQDGQRTLAPKKDARDHIVRIGFTARDFPSPTYFDGRIADVRFYQRALNIQRIAALGTKESDGDSPVARWTFGPLPGAAIHDETGHGHDGTLDVKTAAPTNVAPAPTAPKGPMELIVRISIKPWSNFLAFSLDSKRVAIDNGWNIKLVELESGKLVRDIAPGRPIVGNYNCILSADIAPDGRIIASHEDQMIRVWDQTGAQKVRDLGDGAQGAQFTDLNYSRQGKWVVGRRRNQSEIRLWDLDTGKQRKQYPAPSPVKSLDLHPNGRWIVSIHKDNVIRIWDALTGEPVVEFPDGTKKIARVGFSRDGSTLLCMPQGEADFLVMSSENGQVLQAFAGAAANVLNAAFFPSGRKVASVHANDVFRVWSAATGQPLYSMQLDKEVRNIGISPDGNYVVIVFSREAILYRIRD